MTIELREIWDIDNPEEYKVHFARWNNQEQPLEVWARSPDEWLGLPVPHKCSLDFKMPLRYGTRHGGSDPGRRSPAG